MFKYLLLSTFFASIVILSSCYKDNKEDLYNTGTNCDTNIISWNKDIQPIVQNSCALSGCHNTTTPSAGYDFTTFSGVKLMVDNNRFYDVISSGTMPKGASKLDDCSIEKIKIWIRNGALE
jgi:hypothetical protein